MKAISRLMTAIILLTFFISCDSKESNTSEYDEILVKEVSKENISDDTEETLENTSKLEGVYFTIELQSVDDGSYYIATRTLAKPYKSNPNWKSIGIVDAQGEMFHFASNDEFLNFMAKGGYDMSTQEELRYGWNYTFKKK